MPRNLPLHVLVLVLLAVGAGSCTKVQARTEPVRPALQVPEPPAKVVVAEPEPEPVELPAEIVPEPPVAAPRPNKSGNPRSTVRKPEKEEPPPAAKPVEPKPEEPPAAPPTPSASDRALEQKIRDRVTEARKILGNLNYPSLSSAAKSQFDKARGFLDQAAKALGSADLTLADFLAEKGDTLARGLVR